MFKNIRRLILFSFGVGTGLAMHNFYEKNLRTYKTINHTIAVQQEHSAIKSIDDFKREKNNLIFYASISGGIENAYADFREFNANLANYKECNPNSAVKFMYLAQARQNILNVGNEINLLRQSLNPDKVDDNKLAQSIYTIVVSQQGLMHDYVLELSEIFTHQGITDHSIDTEKFSPNNNISAKSLEQELLSLKNYAERKLKESFD